MGLISNYIRIIKEAKDVVDDKDVPASDASEIVKEYPIADGKETADDGIRTAREKMAKIFYELKSGSSPFPKIDSETDLPDPFSPDKTPSSKSKDKTFRENSLDMDDKPETVDKDMKDGDSSEDDDFDDFDYEKNEFSDEVDLDEDEEEEEEKEDDRTEEEKLQDAIDDAIDDIRETDDDDEGDDGDGDGDGESGEGGDGQSGDGKSGKSQSGEGEPGEGGDGESGDGEGEGESGKAGTSSDIKGSGSGKPKTSEREKRLKKLQQSLKDGDMDSFKENMDDIKKSSENTDDTHNMVGERIDKPTDETIKETFDDSSLSKSDVKDMIDNAKKDTSDNHKKSPEFDEMRRQVVDELEKKCASKGGSALSRDIVKNALNHTLTDMEWKELLQMFLKQKSIFKGNATKSNHKNTWGDKKHLWRDAILPTRTKSRGDIQKIYCFVDFSGSVNQTLVYTFLGKVIDLCFELRYTNMQVYGFGSHLVEPKTLDKHSIEMGRDVLLAQTWDFIDSQHPGAATEYFPDVADEILEIKKKDRNGIILIFGDAQWFHTPSHSPACLQRVLPEKYLDDICCLVYDETFGKDFTNNVSMLYELCKLKHIITTKSQKLK